MGFKKGTGIKWQSVFIFVMLLVVGLYLFGQFTATGADGLALEVPSDLDVTSLMVMKILLVGAFAFGAYGLFMKLSGNALTKKDAFTVILIGVLVLLLWNSVLLPIFQAQSIDTIAFSVGQKLGVFVP